VCPLTARPGPGGKPGPRVVAHLGHPVGGSQCHVRQQVGPAEVEQRAYRGFTDPGPPGVKTRGPWRRRHQSGPAAGRERRRSSRLGAWITCRGPPGRVPEAERGCALSAGARCGPWPPHPSGHDATGARPGRSPRCRPPVEYPRCPGQPTVSWLGLLSSRYRLGTHRRCRRPVRHWPMACRRSSRSDGGAEAWRLRMLCRSL
jgi:hypothetical protein